MVVDARTLRDALEQRGHRLTGQRLRLLDAITATPGHFTAEELRQQVPKVGRATIYRSLKLLVEARVLCRILLEDGNLHYQLSHRGHHHHLLCVECGVSQDLLGCDIQGVLEEVTSANQFQLSGHWLEVYGRCRSCIEKAELL